VDDAHTLTDGKEKMGLAPKSLRCVETRIENGKEWLENDV
jgi:hypothetical protein